MRYFEITSGVRMPVSLEEQKILDMTAESTLKKSDLEERDQEVARGMVTRGLLKRGRDSDNNVVFASNKEKLNRD
jgi:hypothetical protein